MPLNTANIGRATDYFAHDVDARWLMAYAASLNDLNPEYMDTTAGCVRAIRCSCVPGVANHLGNARALLGEDLSDAESASMPVYMPLTTYIFINPYDRIALCAERGGSRATLVGVDSIKPGAGYTLRLDTIDETEDLVCQTFQFGIYRGVLQ